jgi:SAM-dependent methyltransferase
MARPSYCPYCPGRQLDRWLDGVTDRLRYAPGTWSFWRCRDCKAAVLHPAPKPEELATFYPAIYSFHVDVAKGSKLKELAAWLEERLFFRPQYKAEYGTMSKVMGPPAAGARLLDAGCGVGQRLQAFRKMGYDVHGLDFLPAIVQRLEKDLGIPATCGDLRDLDTLFPPASFDVVTAFQVVEHVVDVRAVFRSCLRLLRPGGWFVATIPMGDSLQATLLKRYWCGVREAPRHLNLPSQAGLRRLCQDVGYADVQIYADSVLNCAGLVGLSLLPDSATTRVYGEGSVRAIASRLLAAAVTVGSLPLCYLESHVAKRPATAMVFARRSQ